MMVGLTSLAAVDALTGLVQLPPLQGIPTGPFLCATAVVLGSLLPDIDAEESEIKSELGTVGEVAQGWLASFGIEHRGLTHYGLTTVGVILVSSLIGWWLGYGDVGLALGLGYLSHVLLGDSVTIAGVPLLWPRPGRFHLLPRRLRLRTGGPVEGLILLVLIVIFICLLPGYIPPELVHLVRGWLG